MKKIYLLLLTAFVCAGSFAQFVPILSNPLGTSGNIVMGVSNYHASESIYTAAEIGDNNYISAGSAIQQLFFFLEQSPDIPAVASPNFKIYLKNISAATTVFTTGTYSLLGYTQVFNGALDASTPGLIPVILTTPFARTAGSNLQMLIIRTDNIIHATTLAPIFDAALGSNGNTTALSTRRYNGAVAPAAGTTSLATSNFRPAIFFNHTFPVDAIVNDIVFPTTSCYTAPQSIAVEILNGGTTDIAPGTAATTLRVRGANTFTGTLTNTGVITPGASEFIVFTGINLSNQGDNFDTAFVNLPLDGTTYYDTITAVSAAAPVISTFPISETVEELYPVTATSQLDVFPYAATIVGDNLWRPQTGNYFNDFQVDPLVPLGAPVDSAYYIFDAFQDPPSPGVESRLFSNCIDLSSATGALLTFFMSHDTTFSSPSTLIDDSLYVSVSTDKGVTWTRLQGFQRADASIAPTPTLWRQESVNLNAYIGQTVQIGFEGVSQWGNAILIDNINIAATLPVSLLSFEAQRNGRVNKLNWKTSQEVGTSRFVIERSTDGGQRYTSIGEVTAAGNSSTERTYNFNDVSPVKGINYYRLRMVDVDNSFKYSVVRNVKNLGAVDFVVAPNPLQQQQLKIKLDADKADKGTMLITDMSGRLVYNGNITVSEGSNAITVPAGNLAPGSYIVTIQLSNEKVTRRFNK